MRVLCVIPPYVASYFNAGHHLPVFQVAAFLRAQPGFDVDARDLGALNANWKSVCRLLIQRFDVVAMLNDFDAIDGFDRFVEYCRELSPVSRVITFGRASRQTPGFFEQFGFDAIASEGDYEASVASYLLHLRDGAPLHGVRVRTLDGHYRDGERGQFLPAEQWAFPHIGEIPYAAYDRLYEDDLDKFCGVPRRRELVVPVARGCPVGCDFCDVPGQQGRSERRVSVESVVAYIQDSYAKHPFEYVSFYAPTFTLRRAWVLDLCKRLQMLRPRVYWKCVTTVHHLDDEMVDAMGAAGCVRISVGVETTYADVALASLPQIKHYDEQRFQQLADMCARTNIELNCFLMLGLPGESAGDAELAIGRLVSAGHRVRPTLYTRYDRLRPESTLAEFARLNRQLLPVDGHSRAERDAIYQLIHANSADRPTVVDEKVPKRMVVSASVPAEAVADHTIDTHCVAVLRNVSPFFKEDYSGSLNLANNELRHPSLRELFRRFLASVSERSTPWCYPGFERELIAVAQATGVEPPSIAVSPGGDAALRHSVRVFGATGRAVAPKPCYAGFTRAAIACGVAVHSVPWLQEPLDSFVAAFADAVDCGAPCVAYLENPNGFDGRTLSLDQVEHLAKVCGRSGSVLVIDEAYGRFAPIDHLPLLRCHGDMLLLRTLSKSHGSAGIRLALMFGRPPLMAELRRACVMNDVSQLALDYLLFTIEAAEQFTKIQDDIRRWRDDATSAVKRAHANWQVGSSKGNFVFAKLSSAVSSRSLTNALNERRIRVRLIEGGAGQNYLRFTAGPASEMASLFSVLDGMD